jgi:hypothetical protein
MKITKKNLRRVIKESLIKNLMEMPLRNISFAKQGDEGFDFSSEMPDDAATQYDPQLMKDIVDVNYIKDYFSNSIVDIDILVLPENIIKPAFSPDLLMSFESNLIGIFDTTAVTALISGKYKKYKQVLSKIRSDAFTLVLQTHPLAGKVTDVEEQLSLGEYSLDWGLHDAVGHVIQTESKLYDAIVGILDIPFHVISTITGKTISPFEGGDDKLRRTTGAGRFIKKIEGPSISSGGERFAQEEQQQLKMEFRKDLLNFFKEKNFTPQVGYEDSHASICAYYFVNRTLPTPFNDPKYNPALFTDDEIGDFKQQADNAFKKMLVGKTAVLNFLEREPHVSDTGVSAIKDQGF